MAERRQAARTAAALSGAVLGHMGQIAKEPRDGLGHVVKNLNKLQKMHDAQKVDLLNLLQIVRESHMELQTVSERKTGAAPSAVAEERGAGKDRGGGALAALDEAALAGKGVLEQIKKARQQRAVRLDKAQPLLSSLLTNKSEKGPADEDFSQWYESSFGAQKSEPK
eukprot:g140.t1